MLRLQADHYFGSLRKAVAELKRDRRVHDEWSKPKILKLLSQMHRRHEELGYAQCRRDFPTLVNVAQKRFGSWGRALREAGIDSNLYLRKQRQKSGKLRPSPGRRL